jgi:hypothetical protein
MYAVALLGWGVHPHHVTFPDVAEPELVVLEVLQAARLIAARLVTAIAAIARSLSFDRDLVSIFSPIDVYCRYGDVPEFQLFLAARSLANPRAESSKKRVGVLGG